MYINKKALTYFYNLNDWFYRKYRLFGENGLEFYS
jgi:hypothetical protein